MQEQVENPQRKKTKRIQENQKTACFEFFEVKGYNRNTKLPTGGPQFQLLQTFLKQWELTRQQVKTQFGNWKEKYEFYGEIYETDSTKLREYIASNTSVESAEFIYDVTNEMMRDPTKDLPQWFTMAAEEHSFYNEVLPQMTTDPFKSIFCGILDKYIDIATETFPAQAKFCNAADLKFFKKRKEMAKAVFDGFYNLIDTFDELLIKEYTNDRDWGTFKKQTWRLFFYQIEEKMYFKWCRTNVIDGLPPVSIVNKKIVCDYSLGILYYTAGCLLRKIGKSAIRNPGRKDISNFVAEYHSINVIEAEHAKLPVDLTKVRYTWIIGIGATIVILKSLSLLSLSFRVLISYPG